ncbi:hypothetical protein TYRP_020617 [Tyrophagus putrescentiae]|nr:hypothetical protein TYRP_020617 [Tyrophagus putrescentiae]
MDQRSSWLAKPVKAVLLDITGVLYESGTAGAIPGSIDAIKSLRSSGLPFRLVTNETQNPVPKLVEKLNGFGYDFAEGEIIAPGADELLPEFEGLSTEEPNVVVVGDAAQYFTFEAVNGAFQLLLALKERQQQQQTPENTSQTPLLISMGKNKYYKEHGALTIDLGAYTTALEYAADVQSLVIGKPSAAYFNAALASFGTSAEPSMAPTFSPEEVLMVGDDLMGDVKGAQDVGMRGVLVRTGNDAHHPTVKPDAIVENLAEAIREIIAANRTA